VNVQTAIALVLALASTTLINIAYLREHDAAAALPALSLRRPLHSAALLLRDRSWLIGFALESGGFTLYVLALALAPLTLVQSVSAGGIGILAFVSARLGRMRLGRHELVGVAVSMVGLLALGVSLVEGSGEGRAARPARSSSGSQRPVGRRPSRSRWGGSTERLPSPKASPAGCCSRSATSRSRSRRREMPGRHSRSV
jgi:hypothetical protein